MPIHDDLAPLYKEVLHPRRPRQQKRTRIPIAGRFERMHVPDGHTVIFEHGQEGLSRKLNQVLYSYFQSKSYKFPESVCIKENEPDFFSNVGAYAKDIWEIIKKDGGVECQTEVKV